MIARRLKIRGRRASLKGLQLESPLTALVTYRRLMMQWQERVCADNPIRHYKSNSQYFP